MKKENKKEEKSPEETNLKDKLPNFIQNFSAKDTSKKVLKKIVANKIFFSVLFVILFLFVVGFTKTLNAKPGDLFFFPRTIYERSMYNENEYIDVLKLLKNRKAAFEHFQKNGNCVQARLAEDELLDKYQLANAVIKNTQQESEKVRILDTYLDVFKIQEESINCELIVNLMDLEQIWQFILLNYSSDSNIEGLNYSSRKVEVERMYGEYLEDVKSSSNFNQDQLNQVNNLLVYINSNTLPEEISLDAYIKLVNNEFAINSIQNIIEGNPKEDYWSTKIVILCNNIEEDLGICSNESLISTINSIQNQEQEVNRIENGSIQFQKYLEEGFL